MDENTMTEDVGLIGIQFAYPEFKYTTKELIDTLGNKLSEKDNKVTYPD